MPPSDGLLPMHVRIDGHIRGEPIHIDWRDGTVTGDLELVERARRLHRRSHGDPIDETDPVAFITALGNATPEHLDVHVGPDRRMEGMPGLAL